MLRRWSRCSPHPGLVLGLLFVGGLLMAELAGAIPLPSERPLHLILPLRGGGEILIRHGWFDERCVALDLTVDNRGERPLELAPEETVLMAGDEVGLRLAPRPDQAPAFGAGRRDRAVLVFAGRGGRGELILRLGPAAPPLLLEGAGRAGRVARVTPWRHPAAGPAPTVGVC